MVDRINAAILQARRNFKVSQAIYNEAARLHATANAEISARIANLPVPNYDDNADVDQWLAAVEAIEQLVDKSYSERRRTDAERQMLDDFAILVALDAPPMTGAQYNAIRYLIDNHANDLLLREKFVAIVAVFPAR